MNVHSMSGLWLCHECSLYGPEVQAPVPARQETVHLRPRRLLGSLLFLLWACCVIAIMYCCWSIAAIIMGFVSGGVIMLCAL